MFVAMLGSGAAWETRAFIGWFGPRGLATVVFTVMLFEEDIAAKGSIAGFAIIGVALSVFAHGFTAPPLAGVYARWYSALGRSTGQMPECSEVTQPPVRGFSLRDDSRHQ